MDRETRRSLFTSLFWESRRECDGPTRRSFLARNHTHATEIEQLISEGLIGVREGKYLYLPLLGLDELATSVLEAERVRYLCGHLFDVVRSRFIQAPEEKLSEAELVSLAEMPEDRVGVALRYLLDAPMIWEGWSGTQSAGLSEIIVSPRILQYQSLDEVIADMRTMREPRNGRLARSLIDSGEASKDSHPDGPWHPYVALGRLTELRAISSGSWDLRRLVRMCEELNNALKSDSYISCSMLVRGILDHVPPIFGCASFSEVANNYAGPQSFRKSMKHLDQSLRNHADGNLHTQIRRKESLPTVMQIAYWQDLDRLLEEVVRLLQDERGESRD